MDKYLDSQKVINLLARQELLLSELYEKYSRIFSDKKFWSTLADDEASHFEMIEELKLFSDGVKFEKAKFGIDELTKMVDYIEELVNAEQKPTLQEALAQTYKIEDSLVEKHFFTLFVVETQRLKEIFDKLEDYTEEHVRRVDAEMERLGLK